MIKKACDIQLQSSVIQCNVCWEIIWHLVLNTSRRWVEKKEGGGGEKSGGKREKGREWWDKEAREKWGREGGGAQSIQQSCLYHVIACQLRFKNEAFQRPSRATVQSMLWKCLPRCDWRASHSSTKYKPPPPTWTGRQDDPSPELVRGHGTLFRGTSSVVHGRSSII